VACAAWVGSLAVLAVAGLAGAQEGGPAWGTIRLTKPVLEAWVASCCDPRVAAIHADTAPDPKADADMTAVAGKTKAQASDPKLDQLVRLYGFTGARAWVDATLKVYACMTGALMASARKEIDASPIDKNSPQYKAAIAQMDKEAEEWYAAWGRPTSEEQQIVADSLESILLAIGDGRPAATDPLTLEGLQRWIAAGKDGRIRGALDALAKRYADGPAVLKELIVVDGVDPDLDAAAREQGFAGAHEWAEVTARIMGATLERAAEMRLAELDEKAADHAPEEYKKLLDSALEGLAAARLAFGTRPNEDMELIDKYFESISRVLGVGTPGRAERVL